MLTDVSLIDDTTDIEDEVTSDEPNIRSFISILLWHEVVACARSLGSKESGKRYYLKDFDAKLAKILKSDPGIIGEARTLNLEKSIRLIPEKPNDDEKLNEEQVVFHHHEEEEPACIKTRPRLVTTNNKVNQYVFYGTHTELKESVASLFEALDLLIFGCQDEGFGKMLMEISKIDRTTIRDRALVIKDLFGEKTDNLPDMKDILETVDQKTIKDGLLALEAAGTYRNGGFICRTIGNKTVKFNVDAYLSDIRERRLLDAIAEKPLNRTDLTEYGLRHLRLNISFNKLVHILLHEVYVQRKFDGRGVYIRKNRLMAIFGYGSRDKSKYNEIRNALYALRYFEYKLYENGKDDVRVRETGYFVTRLTEEARAFIIDINPSAVGCIVNSGKRKLNGGEFKRGYYLWAPVVVYASRNFSRAGYLLSQMLFSEAGNMSLKVHGFKIVVFKLESFYNRLQINFKQPSKRYKVFIEALKENLRCGLLHKVEPELAVLLKTRPKAFKDKAIKLFVYEKTEDVISGIYNRLSSLA